MKLVFTQISELFWLWTDYWFLIWTELWQLFQLWTKSIRLDWFVKFVTLEIKNLKPLLNCISIQPLGYSQPYGGYESQKQSSYGQQSYNNQGQQNTESSGG